MSVFKSLITSDVIVSPFKVNKTFVFEGTAALTGSGVDKFIGQNLDPILWVSGSNPTGDISIQDKYLVYRSVRELYYTNFIYGDDGSPANTASFNPDGTITGPLYEPSYYNYLTNTLPANRYFPTGSNEIVGVISIPSNLFAITKSVIVFTKVARSASLPKILESSPSLVLSVIVGSTLIPRLCRVEVGIALSIEFWVMYLSLIFEALVIEYQNGRIWLNISAFFTT